MEIILFDSVIGACQETPVTPPLGLAAWNHLSSRIGMKIYQGFFYGKDCVKQFSFELFNY